MMIRLRFGRLIVLPLCLIAAVILFPSGCPAEESAAGRGERWIRSHPFWISAVTQSPDLYDVDDYRNAGLNTLLAWDPKPVLFEQSTAAGLPIHYHVHQNVGETTRDYVEHVRGLAGEHPGITGLLFYDEPRVPAMGRVGEVCDALRQAFPELLVYSNAMPKGAIHPEKYGFGADAPSDFYAAYLEQFAREARGDVLMVDIYPLGPDGGHSRTYFETLALVRGWGLRRNVPYWIFIQASDLGGRNRRPSESDLRFQLFAPLAFGYTGISYFTYDPALGPGLIDGQRRRTPLYYDASRCNSEVANLGRSLRFLTSTGIAFVPGRHEESGQVIANELPPMPPGPWTWNEVIRDRSTLLRDVRIEGDGTARDVLIGFFRDDEGEEYFMVTNLWHEKGVSAAGCPQTITLTFAEDVGTVTRLSRETGATEEFVVRSGSLQLRLPGGTGDLFRFSDGEFPGLDP